MAARRTLAGLVAITALVTAPSIAQAATKPAVIPLPGAGHVTVAHVVLQRAKGAPTTSTPKLTAKTKPAGIVAGSSFRADPKKKGRFDATVVVAASSKSARRAPAGVEGRGPLQVAVDAKFVVVKVEFLENVEQANDPVPWGDYCDPAGSTGYRPLLVLGWGGTPMQLVHTGCDLARDEPDVDLAIATLLGIPFIKVTITAFPGRTDELVVKIETDIANLNALQLDFNVTVTNFLPPPGGSCTPMADTLTCRSSGVLSGPTVLNARFPGPVSMLDGTIHGSSDGGSTWGPAFPMVGYYSK